MSPRTDTITTTLRQLIVDASPQAERATPVLHCGIDEPLDGIIPFSSVIVLGTVVAVEHHYGIQVSRSALQRAATDGVTLRTLATMVEELGG